MAEKESLTLESAAGDRAIFADVMASPYIR
jgi:hypothetical protein